MLEAFTKAFDLPTLSSEQAGRLKEMAQRLNALPEGVLRQDKAREFLNEMALIEGIPAADALMSMWYANILSGISTQGVNVWGNGIMALLKGSFAMMASPAEAGQYLRGLAKGFAAGRREAAAALRQGVGHKHSLKWDDAQRLGALELISQNGPVGLAQWVAYVGSLGGLTRYVFRALGAMDLLFNYTAMEGRARLATARTLRKTGLKPGTAEFEANLIRELGGDENQWQADLAQATEELRAAGEKVTRTAVNRRAYELRLGRRSEAVMEASTRWADRLTFQQEPEGFGGWISKVIGEFQKLAPGGVPVGRLLVPFNRIVSNLVESALDFTPVGMARAIKGGHFIGGKNAFDAVERRERALSSVFGLGLAGLLYALTKGSDDDDEVTAPVRLYGFGPRDRGAMPEGWRPFTLKVGDQYWSYAETPMGPMLAAVGLMLDQERYSKSYETKTLEERARMALGAALRGFASQGVLSTVADALDLVSGESKKDVKAVLASPIKGAVPVQGLLRDVSTLFDPRKIKDEDVWGAVVKDLPVAKGYGTTPDRNWRGEAVHHAGLPVVRRFVTGQRLDPESRWMGLNQVKVSSLPKQILVGKYSGLPVKMQGPALVESYARRGLALTALENGMMTPEQWDRFAVRAGKLTAERVRALRVYYSKRYPNGVVPEPVRVTLQQQIQTAVNAARRVAMLEEIGRAGG